MTTYFPNYGPEQREMVERWLDRMRSRFAGARDASDIGRVLARERHLETLDQPLPISAQRLAKLEAEVTDVQGEGTFLLVVDCGETGAKATRSSGASRRWRSCRWPSARSTPSGAATGAGAITCSISSPLRRTASVD